MLSRTNMTMNRITNMLAPMLMRLNRLANITTSRTLGMTLLTNR